MDWFKLAYTVLGGLGIFFFGIKLMSESLQVVADNLVRRIINSLTKNRIIAVLVGLTVTAVVQSSSITTVMIVGFVNAGLMNLTQALGVIFGANIGTTLTGWIIAIKIGEYALLFVGVGAIFMLFAKREKVAGLGRLVFALGLVFLGLTTMSGAFQPLRTHEGFLELMTLFAADSYSTLWLAVIMGCVLTFVIQSSSAMLGITIALALSGSITFQTAAALVLGENIGTTVTALLASIGTNVNARRAALGHAIFNVFGVLVMTVLFWHYIGFIDNIIPGPADGVADDGTKPWIAAHIAASHSVFNIVNVLLFLPFINYLARLVCWIIPEREFKESQHLEFLGPSSLMAPGLAIEQANHEIKKMAAMVESMMAMTRQVLFSEKSESDLVKKINKYEGITDNVQKEVMEFMGKVMELSMTVDQALRVKGILRMADELESIADNCSSITKYKARFLDNNLSLDQETLEDLENLTDETIAFYEHVFATMTDEKAARFDYLSQVVEFNQKADNLRDAHLDRLAQGKYPPLANLTLCDIIVSLRRIKNHTMNLVEAFYGGKTTAVEE